VACIADDTVALVVLELVVIRLLLIAAGILVLVIGTEILQAKSQLTESSA